MVRALVVLLALAPATMVSPASVSAQGLLDISPNHPGVWTVDRGVIQFNVMHRLRVLDPPSRKVVNTPTFLLAGGVADRAMVGFRYATASLLVAGEPNEWEGYARWSPLEEERMGVAGAVRAGWNGTVESLDGEVSLARGLGPVRVHLAGRAFSAWRGGDAATAVAGGVVWRLHRWVALAADGSQLLNGGEEEAGWSAGLQLMIPYTPHTLSVHATNVNATTLQSSTVGLPDRRLWGFEFTVPITLSRYFGGRSGGGVPAEDGIAEGRVAESRAAGTAGDTVVVSMDNRLRFLPDTVRIRVGQAVRWENPSAVVHTVTADPSAAVDPDNVALPEGAAPFDSGDLVPGDSFVHVFRVAGEYRYVCLPHELAGMVGTVLVEDEAP